MTKKFTLLFLAAFGVRLFLIFYRSHPSSDEVWAILLSQADFKTIWLATFADLHGPFYFMLLKCIQLVFALNLISLRLISLFFGMLSCLGMGYLGQILKGKRAGEVALILSFFLPASIWAAIFGRYYSLLIFLTVVVTIWFVRFINTHKVRFLVALTFIFTIGVYTHYYFILLPVSFVVFLLSAKTYRKLLIRFLISLSFTVLMFLPGLYALVTLPKPDLIGRHANSLLKLPALIVTNVISSETLIFLYLWEKWWVYLPALVILGLMTGILFFQGFRNWKNEQKMLFVAILLVPPLITIVFAYTVKPLFSLGSLQIFLPALVILLSNGIVSDLQKTKLVTFVFGLVVLASLGLLIYTSKAYAGPRQDMAYFISKHQPGDLVLHSHLGSYLLASFYGGKENNFEIIRNSSVTLPTAKGVDMRPLSLEKVQAYQGHGIWYFESPYVSKIESDKVKTELKRHFTESHNEQFQKSKADSGETYFNVYYYK